MTDNEDLSMGVALSSRAIRRQRWRFWLTSTPIHLVSEIKVSLFDRALAEHYRSFTCDVYNG